MGVDVYTERVIHRPRYVVADYAANPDNASAWYANIRSVEWRTSPPAQVGSQVAFVARFLGRTLSYVYEVVEYLPRELLVMRTADGPFPMETTYTWQDAGDGATLMGLRNRGEPTGVAARIRPLVTAAIRRANRADLARLAALLEGAQAA